jgi:hypothetical protein
MLLAEGIFLSVAYFWIILFHNATYVTCFSLFCNRIYSWNGTMSHVPHPFHNLSHRCNELPTVTAMPALLASQWASKAGQGKACIK